MRCILIWMLCRLQERFLFVEPSTFCEYPWQLLEFSYFFEMFDRNWNHVVGFRSSLHALFAISLSAALRAMIAPNCLQLRSQDCYFLAKSGGFILSPGQRLAPALGLETMFHLLFTVLDVQSDQNPNSAVNVSIPYISDSLKDVCKNHVLCASMLLFHRNLCLAMPWMSSRWQRQSGTSSNVASMSFIMLSKRQPMPNAPLACSWFGLLHIQMLEPFHLEHIGYHTHRASCQLLRLRMNAWLSRKLPGEFDARSRSSACTASAAFILIYSCLEFDPVRCHRIGRPWTRQVQHWMSCLWEVTTTHGATSFRTSATCYTVTQLSRWFFPFLCVPVRSTRNSDRHIE